VADLVTRTGRRRGYGAGIDRSIIGTGDEVSEPPTLGFSDGPSRDGVLRVDLPTLVRTRVLIQAESGGGKSYLLRYLLEQTAGSLPQVVFDLEGEFSTLREPLPDGERLPYLLVSATEGEGDVPADPERAAGLCRAVTDARASVILDLYDLDEKDQRLFTRLFVEELLSLPRQAWEPRLVVIDEADRLAPEGGSSEATATLASLSKRSRKRLLGAVFAVQRLSDLDKGVAGGLKNRFVGMTTLDTDVLRAGNSLGFDKRKRQTLMELEPGTFYCHGPALPAPGVVLARAGRVLTPHGEAAEAAARRPSPPPPPDSLKEVIVRVKDLAAEPEPPAGDPEVLRRRVESLTREVGALRRERLRPRRRAARGGPSSRDRGGGGDHPPPPPHPRARGARRDRADPAPAREPGTRSRAAGGPADPPLPGTRPSMLGALFGAERASLPGLARANLAVLAGHRSPRSYSFRRHHAALLDERLAAHEGGLVVLTPRGREVAGRLPAELTRPLTLGRLHEAWLAKLPELASILKALISAHPNDLSRRGLAERAGYAGPTSEQFKKELDEASSLGPADPRRDGRIGASDLLFPKGLK
jgi:hypothetical protein